MTQKYAVYSGLPDLELLMQPVLLAAASLGVPVNVQAITAAGSYTIPDALAADVNAASKLFTFVVQLSGGAGAQRTLKLPENPMDNQLLLVKCVDAEQSSLRVEPFDGSDSIDGANNYTLYNANQAVLLQAVDQGGGSWRWVVLATFAGSAATAQANWGGPISLTATGAGSFYLGVGYDTVNLLTGNAKPLAFAAGAVLRFGVKVTTFLIVTGDITFNLQKNGVTIMTLGPFDNTDPDGFYSTTTGATALAAGDELAVEVVLANTPAGTAAALTFVEYSRA